MGDSPRLAATIRLFTGLGWAGATCAEAPTLPVGTAAQRKTVHAELRASDGWPFGQRWYDGLGPVDRWMVWLFLVRCGITAGRAVRYQDDLCSTETEDQFTDAVVEVVAQRGPDFAQAFVGSLFFRRAEPFFTISTRLVARLDLPLPQSTRFLDLLLAAPAGSALTDRDRARFVEHVHDEAVQAQSDHDASSGLSLVEAAVARGWLSRAEALALAVSVLDGARSPRARRAWLALLLDGESRTEYTPDDLEPLGATGDELAAQAEALVPVLSKGDGIATELLAPPLLASVGDDSLADVAVAALTASTKKALRVVLGALAARPRPSDEVLEIVGPQVRALDSRRDETLARAVQSVVDTWGLDEAVPEPTAEVAGLWQPVPPVWTVPRFERGEETPEALTQAAAELVARRSGGWDGAHLVVDVTLERFSALVAALARRDPQLVAAALRGVTYRDWWETGLGVMFHSSAFVELTGAERPRESDWPLSEWSNPVRARMLALAEQLGKVPCLLSEPSWADLRIDPADLVARLRAYQEAGVSAAEADLFLALLRLDGSLADEQTRVQLERLDVPVLVLTTGEPLPQTAGPLVAAYLAGPPLAPDQALVEQMLATVKAPPLGWSVPASLRGFVTRLPQSGQEPEEDRSSYGDVETLANVPAWDDLALRCFLRWPDRLTGLRMRQVARRARPLSPEVVLPFLVAPSRARPEATADAAAAVREAWDRGLLRPGADPAALDVPLAVAADALRGLAADGLLAVVWPALDDLAAQAAQAAGGTRLAAGVVDVAGAMADLLPEVRRAVAAGIVGPEALDMPGLRALAARRGNGRAVVVAREVVAALPAPGPAVPEPEGPPFEEIWPEGAAPRPPSSTTPPWGRPPGEVLSPRTPGWA